MLYLITFKLGQTGPVSTSNPPPIEPTSLYTEYIQYVHCLLTVLAAIKPTHMSYWPVFPSLTCQIQMSPSLSTNRSTLLPLRKSIPYSWPCVANYLHTYKCGMSLAFCFPSNYNNVSARLSPQLGHELRFPCLSFFLVSWAWVKLYTYSRQSTKSYWIT